MPTYGGMTDKEIADQMAMADKLLRSGSYPIYDQSGIQRGVQQGSGAMDYFLYGSAGLSQSTTRSAVGPGVGLAGASRGGSGGGDLLSHNTTNTILTNQDSRIGASDNAIAIRGNNNTVIEGGDWLGSQAIEAMLRNSSTMAEFLGGAMNQFADLAQTVQTGGASQMQKGLLLAGAGVLVFLTLVLVGPKLFGK